MFKRIAPARRQLFTAGVNPYVLRMARTGRQRPVFRDILATSGVPIERPRLFKYAQKWRPETPPVDTTKPLETEASETRRQQAGDPGPLPADARERSIVEAPKRQTAPKRRVSHVREKDRRGVTSTMKDMTPDEMLRKGSWAVRVYGRPGALPKLIDDKGRPTRFALTAADWGEPVPKTVAAARRIAAKGHRLLTAYKRRMARRKR